MKTEVAERFGKPIRDVVKVKSWDLSPDVGVVLQMDQPNREHAAYVWLPYPGEGQTVPEIALEYPAEAGRHSGTYPAAGLKRGEPAQKVTIRDEAELDAIVRYVKAMDARATLPEVKSNSGKDISTADDVGSDAVRPQGFIDPTLMPAVKPISRVERRYQGRFSEKYGSEMVAVVLNVQLANGYVSTISCPFREVGPTRFAIFNYFARLVI